MHLKNTKRLLIKQNKQ